MTMTANIFDLESAAKVLGVRPIVIHRAIARGFLQSRSVAGGEDRFLMSDLENWLSRQQDTAPPPIGASGVWFAETENDIGHFAAHVRKQIEKHFADAELVTQAQAQETFDREKKPVQNYGMAYADSMRTIRVPPSQLLPEKVAAKYQRYDTILNAALVDRLRTRAWGAMSMISAQTLPGKTPLEKVYSKQGYATLTKLAQEVITATQATLTRSFVVKDKRFPGNEANVQARIDVKLAPGVAPSAKELVKLAF